MSALAPRPTCGWHGKSINARRLLVRQAVCPMCKAQVGYFCITPTGRPTAEHLARTRRAMEGRCRCRVLP